MRVLAALIAVLLASSCEREAPVPTAAGREAEARPAAPGRAWFVECAAERGIDFAHRSGQEPGRFLLPEILGGGAALLDVDDDGDLDAYLVQSGSLTDPGAAGGNALYRNDGRGTFVRATGSGAEHRGYGMGVATGDVDGDGRTDLYVTNVGANALLRNLGDGRFGDETAAWRAGDGLWGTSAAFVDHDRDGDLDLFVTNYLYWSPASEIDCEIALHGRDYCSPKSYGTPAPDVLLVNEGGRFRDASAAAGLRAAFGNGLGVLCADFDRDGWPDVFVANDGLPNQLWRNHGDGTFRDEALQRGVALDQQGGPKASMGVAAADLDDDADEDLLVVNLAGEADSYHRNDGAFFSDRTPLVGLGGASRPFTRFGVALQDFDNDGWLDLLEVNGRVTRPEEPPEHDPYAEENLLLRGGPEGFRPVRAAGGTVPPLSATSRGAAVGDVDGDGWLDALVVNRDGPAHLLRGVPGPEAARWIRLRVLARGRDDLGARVELRLGTRRLTRTLRTAYSYCAASEPVIHVGLGAAARAEDVRVRFSDGSTRAFGALEAGRLHLLSAEEPVDAAR